MRDHRSNLWIFSPIACVLLRWIKPIVSLTHEMFEFLLRLKQKVVIGLVGGSDLVKIEEQMNHQGVLNFKKCVYGYAHICM